jgi:hypothetical protein
MRQFLTYGSVRGVAGNRHSYRDGLSTRHCIECTITCHDKYLNIQDQLSEDGAIFRLIAASPLHSDGNPDALHSRR